ncbi:hypothetical protein INR49_024603 [Caranx melampygus]|nr:hypothetical protein INR49_024603 [Caranx melampygus]
MNAQKRRMRQLEHKREEREAKERAIEQEKEALRRQIIEEERQQLLKRHATKLWDITKAYCVKTTWITLMKTSERTLKPQQPGRNHIRGLSLRMRVPCSYYSLCTCREIP